jgi:hypothetical protein
MTNVFYIKIGHAQLTAIGLAWGALKRLSYGLIAHGWCAHVKYGLWLDLN